MSALTPGPDHAALTNQPSWLPTRKWIFGVLSGVGVTAAVTVLEAVDTIDVPEPWGSLVGVAVTAVVGYLTRNRAISPPA